MTQARFGQPLQSDSTPVSPAQLRQAGTKRNIIVDPLEDRLWQYYDQVEGISAYVNVLSNGADLVTYYPAVGSNDPDSEPELVEDGPSYRLWEEYGGENWLSTWSAELVKHLSVTGQAWLVPALVEDNEVLAEQDNPLSETEWQVWSTKEVRRALNLGTTDKIPEDDSRLWRVWMPHPQDHRRADSPVRRVADKCELIVLLDRRRIGDSRTRLYAGIWPLPSRLRSERTPSGKTWADLIEEELIAPVNDPAAPSAVIPTMVYLEPDEIQAIGEPISLAVDDPSRIDVLEEKALRRIAIGIDAPQELILGMGDLNHWQAWLIDKSTYSQHLDPLIVRILRSLAPWWRAQLKAHGFPTENQILWRNPATAIATPDRFSHAQVLHERFVISDESLRREGDFGEDDIPTDEEIERRIQIAKALRGSVMVTETEEDEETEPDSANPAEDPEEEPEPEDPPVQASAAVARLGVQLNQIDQTLLQRVERAAAEQVNKVRRSVLDRIASAARRAGIDVGDRDTLPQRLGPSRVAELVPGELSTPEDFTEDVFDGQIADAQDAVADLTEGRNREADADDRTTAVAAILGALAAAVINSVFKPKAPPKGEAGIDGSEYVPMADVRSALDTAGGGSARLTTITEAAMLVGNGVRTVGDLAAMGLRTDTFEWVYGSIPRTPFRPHLDLDGVRFGRWDDPVLENNTWVSGSHFFPGDHRGCRCTAIRTIVDA